VLALARALTFTLTLPLVLRVAVAAEDGILADGGDVDGGARLVLLRVLGAFLRIAEAELVTLTVLVLLLLVPRLLAIGCFCGGVLLIDIADAFNGDLVGLSGAFMLFLLFSVLFIAFMCVSMALRSSSMAFTLTVTTLLGLLIALAVIMGVGNACVNGGLLCVVLRIVCCAVLSRVWKRVNSFL